MDEQYIQDLWNWTTSQDPTFTERYTFESWKNKLQDNSQYRQDFHDWVSSVDSTFSERRPLNDWSNLVSNQAVDIQSQVSGGIVKKKDDTRSVGQIIGDYQESLASESEDGSSESPTITEVSDVSVTEEVPAQPEEQPITSAEVLGYDYTDPEVRNYVQSLGEGAETELRRIQKKKLLDQLQSNKTTEEKKGIADNLRLIDDLNLKEKGIINLANAPTLTEFLSGEDTIADIDRTDLFHLMSDGRQKAAELLYNQQLKAVQDKQKKEAGFVEVNGEFYDPEDLPTGYGFNTALESVNFTAVAGRDEEAVANNLLSKFSQYGFNFQQSGMLDNVTITSPSGNTLEVSVDNFTDEGDAKAGRDIKRFLMTEYFDQQLSDEQQVALAMLSPADMSQVGMGTEFDYEDYYTEAGYDTRRASMIEEDALAIRDLEGAMEVESATFEQKQKELNDLGDALNRDASNPELRAQYEAKRLQLEGLAVKLFRQDALRSKAVTNYNNILNEMNHSLGQRALNYVEWDISNLPELFIGEFARGGAETIAGYIDVAGDLGNLYNFVHEGITGDKLFTDAELKAWKKRTKAPVKQAGELAAGAMFSGDLDPAALLQDGSVTIKDGKVELGGDMVSNKTVAEFNKQGWLAQGFTGLLRSAPAMMTGPFRIASFYAMGAEHIDDQFNNNPELANLSEAEKLKLKIPLGLTVAVLEEVGMRNMLSNSSFVSSVFGKSMARFTKLPVAQQTARTFRETVIKVIPNTVGWKVAKTAILAASSGAAEYETGYLQELADVYGKELYDLANKTDSFKNVINLQDKDGNFSLDNAFNMELLSQANHAGLAEMVGGIVMGMPSAVTQASQSFEFNEISDGHFELFKEVSKVENVKDFLVQQRAALDASVGLVINKDTGELTTQEEADAKMREYEILIGVKNTIPAEFSPQYGKKILSLAIQQKQLKEEIKNLDKSASKEQQRRLKIIEEDIAELSRAAEKELAESTREYEAQKKLGETDLTFKAWRFQEMMKKSVREATKKEAEKEAEIEDLSGLTEEEAEARLLAQQLGETTTPTETTTVEDTTTPTEQTVSVDEQVSPTTPVQSTQEMLDEQWSQEPQANKDSQLEAAEQQLKEEKGPGRRNLLIGRRRAPVITQEEILQRAKENLNQQNISLQEQEVSPTTPTQEVSLVVNPTRSQEKQGNVYTIEQDGQAVGEVMFTQNSKGEIVVQDVDVLPGNQKQGIATKAYQAINNIVGDRKVVSSTMFVEEGGVKPGEKLWESLVRNNLARKTDAGFEMIKQTTDEGQQSTDMQDKDPQFRTKDEAKVQREKDFREAIEDETGDIDFDYIQATGRLREEEEEFIEKDEDVFEIVEKMNEMESGNVSTNLDTTAEGVTINTQELNERTDRELPTITNLQIIDGIPTIFTISDQLRTGDIVNPQTGNTIDNLRGGLGFTGTQGNENTAWANTTEKEATDIFNKAVKTYEQNKEVFEEWWKANPEFAGHIPMSVVKMGEGSILSNEATFRVLKDNLTRIPLKNRRNAVKLLKQSIKDKIKTREKSIKTGLSEKGEKLKPLTIKNYQKEVTGHKETLKTLAKLNPKTIDDVVSIDFIQTLSLPARRVLLEQITFGQPNRAGESKAPSRSDKVVPSALIEGMPKETLELVHLGPITDLIVEPQLKDVPQRNIIALQAIEVGKFNPQTNELVETTLEEAVIDTQHPNYPVGTKGKTIGIVENPVSVVKAYPQAFANAMSGLTKVEKKQKRMSKSKYKRLTKKQQETAPKPGELDEASVGTILTETLGVQNGLPNEEFIGAIASNNITQEQQFISFLNQSFPGVVMSVDQETFDNVMKSEKINKKFVDGKVVYGVTIDGDIYINPEVHNTQSDLYNTAIHEMGHVWQTWLQTSAKGKKIYNRGVELVKQTEEYQKQLEIFEGDTAKAAHEAMAVLIGNKGETITEAATQSKFKEWLLSMWKFIQSSFRMSKDVKVGELQDINLDEFLGMALADIFSGQPLRGRDARSLTKLKNPEVAFSASQDMNQVIVYGRNNGFSDAAIKIYLQQKGYTVTEIKKALKINEDLFDNSFPQAFANVPGGVNEGMAMYDRTLKKIRKFIRETNPDLAQVQAKAQEFLKRDRTFKTFNDTLQKNLLIALNANLQINQNTDVAADVKVMRETVRQRRKGAKELSNLQTQLRLFVRKNFPKTKWESKEVTQLISEITNAKFYQNFESLAVKPDDDIRMVMNKVTKLITQKRVDDTIASINKTLSIKTVKDEGGRKKGVNLLPEAVERVSRIKEDLAIDPVDYIKIEKLQAQLVRAVRNNDQEKIEKIEADLSKFKADAEVISDKIDVLRKEFDKLSNLEGDITDKDAARMYDIEVAILYNQALLMENDSPYKADVLSQVKNNLKNMLSLERDAYNEVIREAKERYNDLKSKFYKDITGIDVDYNDKKSIVEARRKLRERDNQKDRKVVEKIIRAIITPTAMLNKRMESAEGLVSRISKGVGENFGGVSQELIIGRLNESRRIYRGGSRFQFKVLEENARRIFGKNFVSISEKNQIRNVEIILDQARYDSLTNQLNRTEIKKEKRKIQKEINGLVERYSQNEMYYLYNQYKDPANHPGFVTKFKGFNSEEIMKQMNQKLDPKVREWADWQVEQYFPEVYERYNEVYKKIYRTNMPWNDKYAGRLVREGGPEEMADVMSVANAYRTSVGSQSTMMRINNKKSIRTVSGDNMLQQYIDEMEYFRAYGENMNEISKMYSDGLVKDAIASYTDLDTYNVLKGQLEKIIQRRNARLTADHPVFTKATSAFAISKLGLNPTVALKQMTSSLAFADYIGYRNWAKYGWDDLLSKRNGVGKWNKTWQEMYANSPELQNRYERNDFVEILEMYQKGKEVDILGPQDKGALSKTRFNQFRNFLMYLVKAGDMGGVMGSIPNYLYYKDQYKKKKPNATEQEMIDYAIRKTVPQVLSTQQSADIQDKDHYSTDSALMRSFQLFTSSPRALYRKELYALREISRKLTKLAQTMDPKLMNETGKGSLRDNIRTFVTYHFVVPMFFKYVALGLPGLAQDWDEDDTDKMFGLRSLLLGNIQSAFIVGDILTGFFDAAEGKPWAGNLRNIPLYQETSAIIKDYQKYKQASKDETKEKYMTKMRYGLFNLLGIPARQIGNIIDNYGDIAAGDFDDGGQFILKLLNYSDYVQEGPPAEKSSGSSKKKKKKKLDAI